MQVSCILANGFDRTDIDPKILKDIGSLWGSRSTWRQWSTDNVVCYDTRTAKDLIKRAFQAVCNFYVPKKSFAELERPAGVKLFDGEFPSEFDNVEEIISMHLVSENSDLVLLFGFDLTEPTTTDKLEKHKRMNYLSAFGAAVNMHTDTQWVLLDHEGDIPKNFLEFENLTVDTYENVITLLT